MDEMAHWSDLTDVLIRSLMSMLLKPITEPLLPCYKLHKLVRSRIICRWGQRTLKVCHAIHRWLSVLPSDMEVVVMTNRVGSRGAALPNDMEMVVTRNKAGVRGDREP